MYTSIKIDVKPATLVFVESVNGTKIYLAYENKSAFVYTCNMSILPHIKTPSLLTLKARNTHKNKLSVCTTLFANAVKDITAGITVPLALYYLHFPAKFIIDNNILKIANFRGFKTPLEVNIPLQLDVKHINNTLIQISGASRLVVNQFVGCIKHKTKKVGRNLDRRIFLDCVYIPVQE